MSPSPALAGQPAVANRYRPLWFVLLVVWIAAVVAGLSLLEWYKNTPGGVGQTPSYFSPPPGDARREFTGKPHLMMFVHPKCPCSRASLSELAEIVARNRDRVLVEIIFVKPVGAGQDWEKTLLWKPARQIPGVRILSDDGTLAHKLGAETSGYVVLYDAHGRLIFNGGITQARGHEGESAGRAAICALLAGQADAGVKTPVFGCPLFARGKCDAMKGCPASAGGRLK